MSLRKVLVTDTNIWIDLDNGGILKEVFLLPYQFLTPDLAVPELISPDWETLHAFGLESQGLDSASMQDLITIRQFHKSLSVVDLASYLLAKVSDLSLVTGDRHLSDFAQSQGLTVHGILWILDEIVETRVLASNLVAEALMKIINLGARLPKDECRKCIERWSF